MIKLYDGGVYLVNGAEIVPESESEKVRVLTGKSADKAEAKREKEMQDEERYAPSKQTTIQASSYEELLEKIRAIDWNSMKEESVSSGKKIDFSV